MSVLNIRFSQDQDRALRDFVQSAFAEQIFTDCTLFCWAEDRAVGSQKKYRTFKCHRLILSAYSEFFRQCFLDSAKSSEPISLFLDIEPRTLENILRLIYFGHIEIVQSDIELFFNAATKLSLKDFKIANPNDVFNVDADLNHLKRRLTQNESSLPKTSKNSRIIDQQKAGDSFTLMKDKNHNESEEAVKQGVREDEQSDKCHSDIPIVTSSVSRPSASPLLSAPTAETPTAASEGSNAYTCTICNKQYSYKISLNKHLKSAHSN